MSNKEKGRKPSQNSHGGSGSKLGYGKPPRQHQFKPGQSGNPKGRKKGVKNEATILQQLLEQKVEISDRGKRRKLTVREIMYLKCADAALKGNLKALMFLAERYAPIEAARNAKPLRTVTRDMSPEEAQQAYAEQVRASRPF